MTAARLAFWRGPVRMAPLKGGLTNLSYVADDCPARSSSCAAARTFRSITSSATASAPPPWRAFATRNYRPEIIHVDPGIMVLRRFIEGRTLGEDDLRANIARLVPLPEGLPAPRSAATCADRSTRFLGVPGLEIRDYVTLLDAEPALPRPGRAARAG